MSILPESTPIEVEFEPGAQVEVCQTLQGMESDLGRIGIVQPGSKVPELRAQVRVLLNGDRLVRRFQPFQLQLIPALTKQQQEVMQRWVKDGWSMTQQQHELAYPGEVVFGATKKAVRRTLFVGLDGWSATLQQRVAIAQWQSEGWTVVQRLPRRYGMNLELEIELFRQGERQLYLLSAIGWTCPLPSTTAPSSTVSALPSDSPYVRHHAEMLAAKQNLEQQLRQLEIEQKEAEDAGGFSWPNEWAGVSLQDYTVQKKRRDGRLLQCDYYRLESNRPLFLSKTSRSKTGQVKNRHVPRNEYARYRAARLRYEARKELEAELESVGQALKLLTQGKRYRSKSEKKLGDWEIIDTRNDYPPGEYPHDTFSIKVCRWEQGKRVALKSVVYTTYRSIPVDQPFAIRQALKKAQEWIQTNT